MDFIDRSTIDAIDRDTRRRRCDGATDADARECVCVCGGAPHVDVCLSVDDRDALVETDGPNRTHESHARTTDRTTDRDDKDIVIVTRH